MNITAYHAKYYAHELLFDASVDLNPHQIEAALFAMRNPLQQGVLLADEVGLGKTIEAALVVCQLWAERRRRILIIAPASLRKQWAQELYEHCDYVVSFCDSTGRRAARYSMGSSRIG